MGSSVSGTWEPVGEGGHPVSEDGHPVSEDGHRKASLGILTLFWLEECSAGLK